MSQTKKVLASKLGVTLVEVTLDGPGGLPLAKAYVVRRPDTPEIKNFDSHQLAEAHFNDVVRSLAG
ncbi:hypothetical protein SAMN04244559_01044 [Magnetospirillum fulvum]|uniref:Uncharacterized protein n=2 Tax=Magnetospirillum fulvum TaxID=1082 RepID=A0A1H6HA94_MAGFU|nr:hypothetical protein SAMN04244559_01044 [Magnetospirillum fulvum]